MLERVYEAAVKSEIAQRVIVATPDLEIVEATRKFNAETALTRNNHESGTDRIAEVVENLNLNGVVVNVQGDEPLVPPSAIVECANLLIGDPSVRMSTLATDCLPDDIGNPAVVKVVANLENYAMYFSRSAIPYARTGIPKMARHIGMYGFRVEVLAQFSKWEPTPLEKSESLEQLRFLEHGIPIKLGWVEAFPSGIDTPEQAEEIREYLRLGPPKVQP